ncbi:DUF3566 domain-containing protein [Isoptericola sp. AK164]|uniref:DUF3566 domain-containing protein n=1 Tax=Isoptericola sp. AK164 TaxID=3024246 RepID=UPI00241821BD|nr:DUF3566 domain-containing protein [Isoptericola sp. AK164]
MASQKTTSQAGTPLSAPADSTQPITPVSETTDRSTGSERPAPAQPAPAQPASAEPEPRDESAAEAPTNGAAWSSSAEASSDAASSDGDAVAPSDEESPKHGTETSGAAKNGAVKAAAAALAAARTAAKKVQSAGSAASGATPGGTQPGGSTAGTSSSAPPPPPDATSSGPRPEMHYSAGGVHGSAQQVPLSGDGSPQTGAQPAVAAEGLGSPRRVRLSVSRIDPWSIMKLAFLLSVAIGIMTVVATAVVWYSLNSVGTFATVQDFLISTLGPQAVDITQIVQLERTVSLATLIALVNVVLFTAIATIMAMLYNITAALVGGVHLTLTDE